MAKTVALAVAGAGKTRSIVERLGPARRSLVITYTEAAYSDIRRRVIDTFGHVPQNVSVSTYFSFLHGFCFRPYFKDRCGAAGLSFDEPPAWTSRLPLSDDRRFFTGGRRIFHARLARFLSARGCMDRIKSRLARYFDEVLVDEVQDFGGHDFDFLLDASECVADWYLVGDFFQHTFSTSRDGNVNRSLHKDFDKYCDALTRAGFSVDLVGFSKSHRCGPEICEFISRQLGIAIESASAVRSSVQIVTDPERVAALRANSSVVKLFYKSHEQHECASMNWGASKGIDSFDEVCVVLNKASWKQFEKGALREMAPLSRNKLYVACSRARTALYIVPEAVIASCR